MSAKKLQTSARLLDLVFEIASTYEPEDTESPQQQIIAMGESLVKVGPTPEEIDERAAEVRQQWNEREQRQRIVQKPAPVGVREWSGRVQIEE